MTFGPITFKHLIALNTTHYLRICGVRTAKHTLFSSRLATGSFVFFSSRFICSKICRFCPISVIFFFWVLSFFGYVRSNQSNSHDHKKLLQQEQTFLLQISSLFLRASIMVCKLKILQPPEKKFVSQLGRLRFEAKFGKYMVIPTSRKKVLNSKPCSIFLNPP